MIYSLSLETIFPNWNAVEQLIANQKASLIFPENICIQEKGFNRKR